MLYDLEVTVCAFRRFGFVNRWASDGRGAPFNGIEETEADGGGGKESEGANAGATGKTFGDTDDRNEWLGAA